MLGERHIRVHRDYRFAGVHHVHMEAFDLADVETGEILPARLTGEDLTRFLGARFVSLERFGRLAEGLEPPTLAADVSCLIEVAGRRRAVARSASPR